jgi:hypothetical protein
MAIDENCENMVVRTCWMSRVLHSDRLMEHIQSACDRKPNFEFLFHN